MSVPPYVPRHLRGKKNQPKGPSTPAARQAQPGPSSKAEEQLKRAKARAATFKVDERGHNDGLLEGTVRKIDLEKGLLTVEFDPITSICFNKKPPKQKGEIVEISALLFHHARELALIDKANVAPFIEPRKSRRDL